MKSIISLLVLLALATLTGTAVVQAPQPGSRTNVNLGYITSYDRLLHRQYVYRPPMQNTIQYEDVVYKGNRTTRISGVYASEVGYTQYASIWILKGGVGYQNVTLRIQSARGYGYYYLIDIWGRA